MLRTSLRLAVIGCMMLPATQMAFAQRPFVGGQLAPATGQRVPDRGVDPALRGGPAGDRGSRILQSSVMIGAPVLLQGGTSYGKLQDFVIGDTGCMEYAIVSYNNGLVPIPWGVGMWDFNRRAYTVDISRDRIRDFPTIHQISELNNAQFTQRVQTFYHSTNRGGTNRGEMNRTENRPAQPGETLNRGTNNRAARGETKEPRR